MPKKKKSNTIPRSLRNIVRKEKKTTWILLATRSKAKLMAHAGTGEKLALVEGFVNPAGELRNRQLVSDKPGRSYRTLGGRINKHAVSAREDAHEHALSEFAKSLAERVGKGVARGECERIVLAAEPHCLGKIKKALAATTKKRVRASISKDLMALDNKKLYAKLADVL